MNFDPNAWAWPQWTMFSMMLLSLIITTAQHGKARTGDYNGFAGLIGFGLTGFLLTYGGFFGGHQ